MRSTVCPSVLPTENRRRLVLQRRDGVELVELSTLSISLGNIKEARQCIDTRCTQKFMASDKHQPPRFQSSLLLLRSSRIIHVKEQDLRRMWPGAETDKHMVLGCGPQVTVIETRWSTAAAYRE